MRQTEVLQEVRLDEKSILGMYYAWLGFSLSSHGQLILADNLLTKALEIGETYNEERVIAYACTWLSFLKGELGLFEEALCYADRALNIAQSIEPDQYLFFKPIGGIIQVCYYTGDVDKAKHSGSLCLDIGEKYSNVRAVTLGYIGITISHFLRGDFTKSIELSQKAHSVSADPLYKQIANLLLGLSYIQVQEFELARNILHGVITFSEKNGCEWSGTPAKLFMGVVLISTGKMSEGFKMIEKARVEFKDNNRKPYLIIVEYILGKIYLQMVERNESITLTTLLKNCGFLFKNLPFAAQRAEHHFLEAIGMEKEINARGILGQIYLDLGLLYKKKKKSEQAKSTISLAINFFENSNADYFLKQANDAIMSMKQCGD